MTHRDHWQDSNDYEELYGPPPAELQTKRMRMVRLGFVIAFCAIAIRLLQLQVEPDTKFSEEDLRHIGRVAIHEARGDIYDRTGALLATDQRLPTLYANPSRINDPRAKAQRISHALGMDEERVYARLTRRNASGQKLRGVRVHPWLNRKQVEALGDVDAWGRKNLWLRDEPIRFYPQGSLASHVLGFVNYEGDGAEGIEARFNNMLHVVPGERVSRVDARRTLLASLTLEERAPEGGDSLELTLDVNIQHLLEHHLAEAVEKAKAARAMGMVMDARTGAVLAMAGVPTYDPNRFTQADPDDRRNRVVVDMFEPGSVFKLVTAAAALEHGLVTPEMKIDCEDGSFNPYGHRIRDFYSLGVEPFWNAYAQSSNIAIIKIAAMLGPELLETWIRRFGFGQRAGRDFPGEAEGMFRPKERWSRYSMGSLPMGQEISVTVPQLARAFAVIANGGYLVEPYVVERAISRDGEITYEREAPPPQRILSAHTVETMRYLSHLVVTEGTGRRANIQDYRAGGKTGTAQMARLDGRGYDPDRYTAVFAGFAPIRDPELVAVIVVQEPGIRERWGGFICGPVFKEVIRDSLILLNVPPDPVEQPLQLAEFDDTPEQADLPHYDVSEQFLFEPLDSLELIALEEDLMTVGPRLPDLTGKTKRQARATLVSLGLKSSMQGAGWVVEQDPPPGTPLKEVTVCRLRFGSRADEAESEDDETESAA